MANKKANKFAAENSAVKTEIKEDTAMTKPEETIKTEEKSLVVQTEAKESVQKAADNAPAEAKQVQKKTGCKTEISKKLVIEFDGAGYCSCEIIEKCKAAYSAENPDDKLVSIEVYINVNERRAYYVANGKAEGKYIAL